MYFDMYKRLTKIIAYNLRYHTTSRTTTNIGIGSGIASNVINGIDSRITNYTASGIESGNDVHLARVFSKIIRSVRFMAIVAQNFVRSTISFNITT
jgi:hypothetical protein